MRLASLLAALSDEDLGRLAVEHVRPDAKLLRPQLCNFLETAIQSYRFVQQFILNRQPPTFAILTLLLDAPEYALPAQGFPDRVLEETRRIADLLDRGELLARENGLRLYRAALHEARRNDIDINGSEGSMLAVLRREQEIAQVEHFLIEHHQDLREFWDKEHCFPHEQNALRSAGLVFAHQGRMVIAEEVAPAIRQTLGIEMPTDGARRLLGYLANAEMGTALGAAGSRTAGSKETRLERILTERIQPRVVLRSVGLSTLRDICREAGAPVAGNKDELIDRVIDHFTQGKDQQIEEPPAPRRHEERRLDVERFIMLFSVLLHQELTDILRRYPDLRQTGTKEIRIATLWGASLAEDTLLSELMNRDLEDILHRLGLRLAGSKQERIARIIDHFAKGSAEKAVADRFDEVPKDTVAPPSSGSPEMLALQELFRQKASSPHAALQPWLEELLEARGFIRCYATEDANPSKQLKNKLSQAAAAREGMLVLVLADEGAFQKTKEALLDRWATNEEWPKSVACVALAYPLGTPAIRAIVEWTNSPWPTRIRERLFASVDVLRAKGNDLLTTGSSQTSGDMHAHNTQPAVSASTSCAHEIPIDARFCPQCGMRVMR